MANLTNDRISRNPATTWLSLERAARAARIPFHSALLIVRRHRVRAILVGRARWFVDAKDWADWRKGTKSLLTGISKVAA